MFKLGLLSETAASSRKLSGLLAESSFKWSVGSSMILLPIVLLELDIARARYEAAAISVSTRACAFKRWLIIRQGLSFLLFKLGLLVETAASSRKLSGLLAESSFKCSGGGSILLLRSVVLELDIARDPAAAGDRGNLGQDQSLRFQKMACHLPGVEFSFV